MSVYVKIGNILKGELNLLKKHNYSPVLVTFKNMAVSTIIRYNKYKKKYLDN